MFKQTIRLAIAQISTDPGQIPQNTQKIIEYIDKAKRAGAEIIVFPELAIPGYMSLDLILSKDFVQDNLRALDKIKQNTKDILVVVGFIDQDKTQIGTDGDLKRYNSAAIIFNGELKMAQDKTLLPNYDVFFENRYFAQGREKKLIDFRGLKLGIQICEDLWDENYPVKISEDLTKKGADILINISCSPFYLGKRVDRERLIKKVSVSFKTPFIYVNCIGVQDGYDGELIFDGESIVCDYQGKLISLGKKFEEQLLYINSNDLFNEYNQAEQTDSLTPSEELFSALVLGIRDYFRRTEFTKAFIGLSGGIDSAVTAVLAVNALGVKNVVGIYMPSVFSSKDSERDCRLLAKNLGIKLEEIPINDIYNQTLTTLSKKFDKLPFDTTEENIQARIRGMVLMAHANKFNGLVIITANKTETALGYTTLYGDMCGAIAPISDVSKIKVYELANLINETSKKEIIPQTTIDRNPTAELRPNQTDEESLGGSYKLISPLVDEIIEERKTILELEKRYPRKLVTKVVNLINKSEYKRRQAAPGIKTTKKSFGIGRRIPISY